MYITLAFHLVRMLVGFFLATLIPAITVTVVIVNVLATFESSNVLSVLFEMWQHAVMMYPMAVFMTALFGFPGWFMASVFAEFRNIRRKYWFAAAGALNALLAVTLSEFSHLRQPGLDKPSSIAFMMFCGFLAGLAYWRIAGCRSGLWKGEKARDAGTVEVTGKYVAMAETTTLTMARVYVGFVACTFAAAAALWVIDSSIIYGVQHFFISFNFGEILQIISGVGVYIFYPVILLFIVAEVKGWRSWQFYTLSGIVFAVLGAVYLSLVEGLSGHDSTLIAIALLIFCSAVCGAINGVVYWLIAGRNAGKHLGKIAATSASKES
jgi:hypothetical protein